jgi:hypothetical protein
MVFLTVIVHPIDTAAHPTVPPGYRWAVMVGHAAHDDMRACANAGWAPDRVAAIVEGDQNGATAARVVGLAGGEARYAGVVELPNDPIPAGCDRVNVA